MGAKDQRICPVHLSRGRGALGKVIGLGGAGPTKRGGVVTKGQERRWPMGPDTGNRDHVDGEDAGGKGG